MKKLKTYKKTFLIFLLSFFLTGCFIKNTENEKFEISVKDLTPPVITILKNKTEITEGDKFDLEKCYKVTDNMTEKTKIEISDNGFDTKKVGTYNITVTATDDDGNSANAKFTVVVKEKTKPVQKEEKKDDSGAGGSQNSNSGNNNQQNNSSGNSNVTQQPSQSENSNSGGSTTVTPSAPVETPSQPSTPVETPSYDDSDDNWDSGEGEHTSGSETFPFASYGGSGGAFNACASALRSHAKGGCTLNSDGSGYILNWVD